MGTSTLIARPTRLRTAVIAGGAAIAMTATLGLPFVATAAVAAEPTTGIATLTPVQVPNTAPMIAAAVPLSDYGYTETEFYATGVASRYRTTAPLSTFELIDTVSPYKTRVLVRTPDPSAFNGTLVVEWANVTVGQDVDFAFAESYDYLLSEGYAVAVVSAQRVGVERLKTWSAERYGDLSVAASNIDPVTGGAVDPTNDPLAYDIYTQITRALQSNSGAVAPLPGLDVERTIALGESQSAGRLTNYYNGIQPLTGVFDGFVYLDGAGALRADQAIPAISVRSDVFRPAPSPATSTYTRTWEVAGATHASYWGAQYVDALLVRDRSFVVNEVPLSFTQLITGCTFDPIWSKVHMGYVLDRAIDATNEWIITGTAAPASSFFERAADGTSLRDANNVSLGGVRLPDVTQPTVKNNPINPGPGFCRLVGSHQDSTAAELKSLYKNHGGYVSEVTKAASSVAALGYILPGRATEIKGEAARSNIGK